MAHSRTQMQHGQTRVSQVKRGHNEHYYTDLVTHNSPMIEYWFHIVQDKYLMLYTLTLTVHSF
jgi:hypothetical protein